MTCQGDCALDKRVQGPEVCKYWLTQRIHIYNYWGIRPPKYHTIEESMVPNSLMVVYEDPLGHNTSESLKHHCSTYGSDQVVQSCLHSSY